MAEPSLIDILRILSRHQVEFIVVGGMAAVIGGVPIVTRDVDVLRGRSPENVARMLAALDELDAVFRLDDRGLRPNGSHLEGPGHLLLKTRFGVLDLLGTVEDATTFESLLPDSRRVDLEDLSILVVSLERLLGIKRQLGRPKDRLMVLQIEATLDESKKR